MTRDCIIETEKILEGNGLDLNKTLYSSDFLSGMAFDNPADVGNLTSGSSAFSKSSLNIWKFMVAEAWLGEF